MYVWVNTGIFVLIRPDHTWVDLDNGVVCAWADNSHTFRSKCRLDEFDRVILETNVVSETLPNSAKTDASEFVDYSIYLAGEKSRVLLDMFDDESEADSKVKFKSEYIMFDPNDVEEEDKFPVFFRVGGGLGILLSGEWQEEDEGRRFAAEHEAQQGDKADEEEAT